MLNGKEVEKALENVFNFLDTIDLSKYINKHRYKTVRELMKDLEKDFSYEDKYSKSLFDGVAEDEFVEYLNKKYDMNIKETVVSFYYIR